jgi:hypothetical protein
MKHMYTRPHTTESIEAGYKQLTLNILEQRRCDLQCVVLVMAYAL